MEAARIGVRVPDQFMNCRNLRPVDDVRTGLEVQVAAREHRLGTERAHHLGRGGLSTLFVPTGDESGGRDRP